MIFKCHFNRYFISRNSKFGFKIHSLLSLKAIWNQEDISLKGIAKSDCYRNLLLLLKEFNTKTFNIKIMILEVEKIDVIEGKNINVKYVNRIWMWEWKFSIRKYNW